MLLYKIMPAALWASADTSVPWAPVDDADGFFHLSDASQVLETARKHFHGQRELVLLVIDRDRLTEGTLRWEPSRGGALFPHVYGAVPIEAVQAVHALPEIGEGFTLPS